MAEGENKGPSDSKGDGKGKKPETVSFDPFVVEFGDDSNRSVRVAIVAMQLRGRFTRQNCYAKDGGGRPMGQAIQRMPDIPGQRLAMRPLPKKPGSSQVLIFDPLENDPALLREINQVMSASMIAKGAASTFIPRSEIELDPHQTKSLLLELNRQQKAGKICEVVDGHLPNEEEISLMPGQELYDTWSNNPRKPRFVKDVEEWEQRLERA